MPSRPRHSRARAVAALTLVVALLAGCRGRADVIVAVGPDGRGQVQVMVSLDAEAAAKAGDLAAVARLDDLRRAGWRVDGPGPTPSVVARAPRLVDERKGALRGPLAGQALALTHPFANVAQANALLASVSGPSGPLRAMTLTRATSFTATKVTARGSVDFHRGLDSLGDAELAAALKGRTVSQLARSLNGGTAPAAADVELTFQVWGHGMAMRPGHGGSAVVATHPGDTAVAVDLVGSQRHTSALALAALALVLAIAALVLFVLPRLPGRAPPPPATRKRQLRSADSGWDLVARRNPTIDASKADRPKGRHSRPRGQPPSWRDDDA